MRDEDPAATGVTEGLRYPIAEPPPAGGLLTVAPGVHWLRMPLPFSLDHINLWLLDDGDGVAIVDTGLAMREGKEHWQTLFDAFIGARPVTRIIVTHYHPDHIGLAGWLSSRTGTPISITRTEYLMARMLCLDVRPEPPDEAMAFYRACGLDDDQLAQFRAGGWGSYARGVSPLPAAYIRLQEGDELVIGGFSWRVVVGKGHAPEHACLHDPERGLLISGDQVLPTISSNVSVHPTEPLADPLADWLWSLKRLAGLGGDPLVLPSHGLPFYGLDARLSSLTHGHVAKLLRLSRRVEQADRPLRVVDCLNTLFGRRFDDCFHLSLALGEALAHLRYLENAGLIARAVVDGVNLYHCRDAAPDLAGLSRLVDARSCREIETVLAKLE